MAGRIAAQLSNTAFFIEALRETGLPADDPNLQKAIAFISRGQNLKSEFNDQSWAERSMTVGSSTLPPMAVRVSPARQPTEAVARTPA